MQAEKKGESKRLINKSGFFFFINRKSVLVLFKNSLVSLIKGMKHLCDFASRNLEKQMKFNLLLYMMLGKRYRCSCTFPVEWIIHRKVKNDNYTVINIPMGNYVISEFETLRKEI